MAKKDNIVFYGTGRRKSSVARVRLVEGTGKITINGKEYDCKFKLPERPDTSKSITTRDLGPIPYWLVEDVTEDYKSDVTDLFGINATSLKIERIYIGSFTPLR